MILSLVDVDFKTLLILDCILYRKSICMVRNDLAYVIKSKKLFFVGIFLCKSRFFATPTRKSVTTNKYSEFSTGGGVSPMVVSVSVDQYIL